ncbi:MAG: hypothetical protein U0835_13470 [Isosphaeraceae bacterium]
MLALLAHLFPHNPLQRPPSRVYRKASTTHPSRVRQAFGLALLMLFAAGLPGRASAAPSRAEDEHARRCHCGPRCRTEACCCARRAAEPPARSPATSRSEKAADRAGGLCIACPPCDEGGAPSPSSVPVGRSALVVSFEAFRPAVSHQLLPPPASCGRPFWCAARLEKPPKRDDLA